MSDFERSKGAAMDENTLRYRFFQLVAAVIALIIISASGCAMWEGKLVRDMVQSGAHPLDARCSLGIDLDDVCLVRAPK